MCIFHGMFYFLSQFEYWMRLVWCGVGSFNLTPIHTFLEFLLYIGIWWEVAPFLVIVGSVFLSNTREIQFTAEFIAISFNSINSKAIWISQHRSRVLYCFDQIRNHISIFITFINFSNFKEIVAETTRVKGELLEWHEFRWFGGNGIALEYRLIRNKRMM